MVPLYMPKESQKHSLPVLTLIVYLFPLCRFISKFPTRSIASLPTVSTNAVNAGTAAAAAGSGQWPILGSDKPHHVLCPEAPPSRPFSSFRLCMTFCAACIQLQRTRDGCSAVLRRNRCTTLQDRRVQRSRSTCCGTSAAAPRTMPCALPSGSSGMHGCSTVLWNSLCTRCACLASGRRRTFGCAIATLQCQHDRNRWQCRKGIGSRRRWLGLGCSCARAAVP